LIIYGAISSLTDRSVQLLTRIKAEPSYILIGGILRWDTMAKSIMGLLKGTVNVPDGDMPQYVSATGAALLGHLRLRQIEKTSAVTA